MVSFSYGQGGHAFHIDMLQNIQQKCYFLFYFLVSSDFLSKKRTTCCYLKQAKISSFILHFWRWQSQTSHKYVLLSTEGVQYGWLQVRPQGDRYYRHCWRNHSCAGRSCVPACCVCLLILFMIVYVKKQQQPHMFSCVVICDLHLQTYIWVKSLFVSY